MVKITHYESRLGLSVLLGGRCASGASPQSGTVLPPVPPLVMPLRWTVNNDFGGFYTIDLGVGTPPQLQRLIFDTDFPDIEIHAKGDPLYTEACKTTEPLSVCSVFDNHTSSSFYDYGAGTYFYMFQNPPEEGDYISDSLAFAYGVRIQNQTLALANSSAFPFADFGLAGPRTQHGVSEHLFPEYPSFLKNFIDQGYYDSATFSLWLDPSLGPDNSPNSFPDGEVIFGGVDTELFQGKLTTLPVVNSTVPTPVDSVGSWSLALTSVSFDNGVNLVHQPVSCVMGTGSTVSMLPNEAFEAILERFPHAVHNSATGQYEVSCSERVKATNSLKLMLSDPYPDPEKHKSMTDSITVDVPASQVVWPLDRLIAGGDPKKCALAVRAVGPDIKQQNCELGINVLKNGYWVYDLGNSQISYGQPVRTAKRPGNLVRIPKGGVSHMV